MEEEEEGGRERGVGGRKGSESGRERGEGEWEGEREGGRKGWKEMEGLHQSLLEYTVSLLWSMFVLPVSCFSFQQIPTLTTYRPVSTVCIA